MPKEFKPGDVCYIAETFGLERKEYVFKVTVVDSFRGAIVVEGEGMRWTRFSARAEELFSTPEEARDDRIRQDREKCLELMEEAITDLMDAQERVNNLQDKLDELEEEKSQPVAFGEWVS